MTERLYYTDPALCEFSAKVVDVRLEGSRTAVLLDRTAFYPTSGGQLFDTGWLEAGGGGLRVSEVAEHEESGAILHFIEPPGRPADALLQAGTAVQGRVDFDRRRDHMQQHSGQHLLSAVFIKLFNAPTVSFHMGDESCTIDLAVDALTPDQVREAELHANRLLSDDLPVTIRFATLEEAQTLGVRKIPPGIERLRLIEIKGVDLTACGGTHVSGSGQIGSILLRKVDKIRHGTRVEFVCGERAVRTAARDQAALRAAADLFSAHLWDVPEQARKLQDEVRGLRKDRQRLHSEIAELLAERLLAQAPQFADTRLVCTHLPDLDAAAIKLIAHRLTANPAVMALLGASADQPALIFAQSPGGRLEMGALMKETLSRLGGRGGGTRDMAQGGVPAGTDLQSVLDQVAGVVRALLAP